MELEDVEEVELVDEFVAVKEESDNSDLEIIEDPLGDAACSSVASTSAAPERAASTLDKTSRRWANHKFLYNASPDLPECWSKIQCDNFKLVNKWLQVKNGKLGCKICSTSGIEMMAIGSDGKKYLSPAEEKNIRPPQDWMTCQVTFTGRSTVTRQSSLRKKIFEHKKSKFHLQAVCYEENIEQNNNLEQLVKFKDQLDKNSTIAVFTSAYETVKLKLPFSTFQTVCSLPGLENLFSNGLSPEKVFTSIINHVASKLRESMIKRLMSDKTKRISIVMHESGIMNNRAVLAVHFKFHIICGREIFHSCIFFDLLPLNSNVSEEVVLSLITCLKKNNINMEYLRKNLVAFIFDEKSQVLGRCSNVAKTLTRQIIWFPNVNIKYDFNPKLYDDVRVLYQGIASGVILPVSMFTTGSMADAMFISIAGRPAENFNAAEMAHSWLTKENTPSQDEGSTNLPQISSYSGGSITRKISNDMALASDAHDDQRLVIDLQSESNCNSNPENEDVVQECPATSPTTLASPLTIFEDADSKSSNNGASSIKRRKQQDSHSDTDIVAKGKETNDLCTCTQDNDRLFLLSLLPFMKQLDNRDNLQFRIEVQQLLQNKFK